MDHSSILRSRTLRGRTGDLPELFTLNVSRHGKLALAIAIGLASLPFSTGDLTNEILVINVCR